MRQGVSIVCHLSLIISKTEAGFFLSLQAMFPYSQIDLT